jgi:hypothetical protein
MIESISKNCLISKVSNYAAAGQATHNGAEIDLASPTEGTFDSVCFIATFGAITDASVITLKAIAGDTAGLASGQAYATTFASHTGATSSNKQIILDVVKPGKRYIKSELIIGTQNAALDNVIAIRYNSRNYPTQKISTIAEAALSVGMS